jgi:pyruvate kinase
VDGADAVMLSGETAAGTLFKLFKRRVIEAVELTFNSSSTKHSTNKKQSVYPLKQFVVMRLLWQMR